MLMAAFGAFSPKSANSAPDGPARAVPAGRDVIFEASEGRTCAAAVAAAYS